MIKQYLTAAAYFALGVAAFATYANAQEVDRITLSQHADWVVKYVNSEPSYCTMEATNRYGESVTVAADHNDTYNLFASIDVGTPSDGRSVQRGFERGEWETFDLLVDGRAWTSYADVAIHFGDGLVFLSAPGVSYEFRRALAHGRYLDSDFDSGWSLRGSAAALKDLDRCRQRLGSF